ncbi:MAG: site-specific integrase, partial [Ruminococcus sp.]|nr:site-specific integrase [Ruminococcus sp.]
QTSYRTIPLTAQAYNILLELKEKRKTQKLSEELSKVLTFTDRKTGQTSSLVMSDLVFINFRTGMPAKNSSYDTHLYKLCETAGIPPFSMHTLRHTYATRAIDSGMQPKILQKLLGHASITTTMDTYVHVTDDSMTKAIQQFEAANTAVTKTQ